MVFWVGILVAASFAWFAVKMGFYETWVFAFNIVISVYLAIYLQPIIVDTISAASDTPYSNALTMITTAAGAFLILHGISYIFLTSRFSVSFPKIFDTLGAGFLGFLAGFLAWSFIGLLICITPISQNIFVKEIGFGSQIKQTNVPYISWWCNLVNTVASCRDNEYTTEQAIDELLKSAELKAQPKPAEPSVPAEPNVPAEPSVPAEPNNVETSVSEEDQLGSRLGLIIDDYSNQ